MRVDIPLAFLAVGLGMISPSFAQTPAPAVIVRRAKDVVTFYPRPEYPEAVRKQHKGGAGVFALHVDIDTGLVTSVSVERSTGVELLDRSCKKTFRQWRFKPHETPAKVRIPITFTQTGARY
jgi:TonB family protein